MQKNKISNTETRRNKITKRLEELLNVAPVKDPLFDPAIEHTKASPLHDIQEKLEEFDKISAALPRVKGLGDISDGEFDTLANKAEQAYDDLMDLGMNVEPRYGARMFEVAAQMMNAAISAKSAKIDKKLKMVDLQLKKLAIEKKNTAPAADTVEGEGYIITDRNSLLEKLKNLNK